MGFSKYILAGTALAVAVHASPAPQAPNFPAITAAPSVANGPVNDGDGDQTASLVTTFSSPPASSAPATAAAVVTARALDKRTFVVPSGCTCPWYDPFCWVTPPTCPSSTTTKPATSTTKPATTSTTIPTTSAVVTSSTLPSCPSSTYTPYYAALATGYTTDPALAATKTTTAGQACATQIEAGTYCGFINPLDPCAPQPDGYGPVPSPDTASAFLSYAPLQSMALTAPSTVPAADGKQYTQVFKDLNGATSAQSYLGLRTLKSYDVKTCAAFCDCTDLCTAFNIYAERDPSLNPANNDSTYNPGYQTVWGQSCPNPPSQTTFKCTLWGSSIDASTATNTGETREQFQVVITASDGYDKTNVTTPSNPVPNPPKPAKSCGGKGINAPKYCIGQSFFPGPFNPNVCYLYALGLNSANKKAGVNQSCKFFNAYYLFKNNQPHGTYCNLYNSEIDISFATYSGGKSGSDQYDCKQSWGYSM